MIYCLESDTPSLPESGDFWIAQSAHVIGKITIGEGCSIWFGATLRGDNEPIVVGDGTNIQENAILHTDLGHPLTIGEMCTVGHNAILHGCTIKDRTLIGMGTIVLNGAQIGSDCLIGAGSLITEGKVIPDGSLVIGSPGRVIRPLEADEIAGLRASAENYRRNGRRFATGLTKA